MAWKVVPKFVGRSVVKKTITIFKDKRGWRLFIGKHLRNKFGNPKYINFYVDDWKFRMTFPQKKAGDTRSLNDGHCRLPMKNMGLRLEGMITKLELLPEFKDGGLVVTFKQYGAKDH